MLTNAYGVGGWVGLKNINAYGCLWWIGWVGRRYPNAYGFFYGGGGLCVWYDFDQKQVQFQHPQYRKVNILQFLQGHR